MNLELTDEALELGRLAGKGADLAELGVWDLDPRAGADELEAVAAVCRATGDVAVAERLCPFVALDHPDAALALVLRSWVLLGMLDRAMELTCGYVLGRQQFGQPLASFQGVQFQLTDAEVERAGLDELARYGLWSMESGRPEALDDALALRVAAIEAADVVFRVCHQLHGAIGFCDETELSWLSRRSQPLRREPFGLSRARELLVQRIGRRGLAGLFPESR